MATVLVKNLPNVTSTDDDDLLIVNIGGGSEYTTSNIKIGDLRTVLNSSGNTFSSDIVVDGSVTITDTATQGGKTFVGNLVGQVTGEATSVGTLSNHSTDTLTEGNSNKYFTQTNFNAAVQVTQVGMLADVTISGGGTSTTGKFLLHDGTAFVEADISAYDQSTDVTDLGAQLATTNTTVGTLGTEQTAQAGRLDALEADVSTNTTDIGITNGAPSLQTQISDLGTSVSANQSTHVAQTTEAFEAIRDEAVTALAVFQTAGATTENKLNACQSFFDNIASINVQP